jgi:hypothetical protein
MNLAAFDPHAPVSRVIDLLLTILQPIFWVALCLGFVLAGAHFLTMLATRWGERRVSGKALFFSLAVHLSIVCGVIALIPEYRQRLLQFIDPDQQEPIRIRTVVYEAERDTPEDVSGNTPIWDQLAKADVEDLTRFDKTMQTFEPDAGPQPQPEEVQLDQRVLPDVDMTPQRPTELPQQQQTALESLQEQAVLPLEVEAPQTMANEDQSVPSTTPQRASIDAPNPVQESTERRQRQGTVDRPRSEYAPIPDVASIEARNEQIAQLERRQNEEIRRREGPAPAQLETEEIGRSDVPQARGDVTPPAPQALTRSEMQRPVDSSNESLPTRQRSELSPRTPNPLSESPLASLEGMRGRDAELPSIQRQNFEPLQQDDLTKVPAAYQMRAIDRRNLAARQFGGTEESEQAVELALQWMASVQHPDGYWDASRFGAGSAPERAQEHERPNAGADADTGITALAALAFLGAGHTPENGEYAPQVRRALEWLIRQQGSDGYLGGRASYIAGNYCHGMATFALAEAYALRSDPAGGRWLRDPVARAVDFIVSQQTPDGSWRYVFVDNTYGDMSMFGWQFMALKSAEAGGIRVPERTRTGLTKFLIDMGRGSSGGLAPYRSTDRETAPMTAEALFCKQMLGLDRDHASSDEATRYLMRHLPSRPTMNLYYWYYGTLAMFQYGGERWQTWNESLRDLLVVDQIRSGPLAGTWDPRGDEWGLHGGRMYSTAMATLCLEVYYRYLPLYKMGGRYEEAP